MYTWGTGLHMQMNLLPKKDESVWSPLKGCSKCSGRGDQWSLGFRKGKKKNFHNANKLLYITQHQKCTTRFRSRRKSQIWKKDDFFKSLSSLPLITPFSHCCFPLCPCHHHHLTTFHPQSGGRPFKKLKLLSLISSSIKWDYH